MRLRAAADIQPDVPPPTITMCLILLLSTEIPFFPASCQLPAANWYIGDALLDSFVEFT
jgi:hypothetical protein